MSMSKEQVRFAEEHGLDAVAVTNLTYYARQAKAWQERHLSEPGSAEAADAARRNFETFAKALGFETRWDALWPTLTRPDRPGEEFRPPSGVEEDMR